MKRFLITISALLLLNSTTEIHELFKLSCLLNHFREHRVKDHDLSFIHFLEIHYTGTHPSDNDDREDDQLPFHSVSVIVHTDIPVLLQNKEQGNPITLLPENKRPYYTDGPLSKRNKSVFHPPRLS
jgi:hypothetical protein